MTLTTFTIFYDDHNPTSYVVDCISIHYVDDQFHKFGQYTIIEYKCYFYQEIRFGWQYESVCK